MIAPDEGLFEGIAFRNASEAFELAIAQGRLSDDPTSPTFAGLFMYMGTQVSTRYMGTQISTSTDLFKHIMTREYIP